MEQEVKLQQIKQLIMAKNIGLRDAVHLRARLLNDNQTAEGGGMFN
jgi:hypothetical protein